MGAEDRAPVMTAVIVAVASLGGVALGQWLAGKNLKRQLGHDAIQREKDRKHQRDLAARADSRANEIARNDLYAELLGAAYRIVGAWYQVVDASPRTEAEHDIEFERRQPLLDVATTALARVRIVASEPVVIAAEFLHDAVARLCHVARDVVDEQLPRSEWFDVDAAVRRARVAYVDAVRAETRGPA
jgi:hypothetical protein